MKFSTSKEELLKAIQTVQAAISAKSSLPILSNMLIESTEEGTTLTATDFEIGIISNTKIKAQTPGAITVPAKKFSDIIRELPTQEPICVSVKKNNLVSIECGRSVFKMMGLPKEEFPQPPEFKNKESLVIAQKKLKKMIKMTKFAVSNDTVRYVLNGILFTIKPSYIRLVATDGRCLAMIEEKMQLPKTLERKFIVPAKAINEIEGILKDEGDVKISLSENQALFDTGDTKLVSRLIEGEFPNYEKVIPEEAKNKIIVNKGAFLAALKRVALFTTPESMVLKLELGKDKIVVSKASPSLGEAREEIDCEYKGKEISIGFNPSYIIDLLKSAEQETMDFELTDPDKPGVVRLGAEYVYVVMPRQID